VVDEFRFLLEMTVMGEMSWLTESCRKMKWQGSLVVAIPFVLETDRSFSLSPVTVGCCQVNQVAVTVKQ